MGDEMPRILPWSCEGRWTDVEGVSAGAVLVLGRTRSVKAAVLRRL